MPGYNGSGVYQRFRSWEGDAAAGVKIRADFHDTEDNGFAAGLSNAICRDGQSTITANIPFNAKKITNLAAGTDPTDAINLSQLTALKTFPTGIILSGSTTNGRVTFTGATGPWGDSFVTADLAFGVSGTTWVWNDKADFSGTDVMVLNEWGTLSLTSKDDTSNAAPYLQLHRLSPTPAAGDSLGAINFYGNDSSGALTIYGNIAPYIADPTNASEDGGMRFNLVGAGSYGNYMTLHTAGLDVNGRLHTTTVVRAGGNVISEKADASEQPSVSCHVPGRSSCYGMWNAINNTLSFGPCDGNGSPGATWFYGNASGVYTSGVGNFISAGGTFTSGGASVILSTYGAGMVYLRPNAYNSALGEVRLDSSGRLHTDPQGVLYNAQLGFFVNSNYYYLSFQGMAWAFKHNKDTGSLALLKNSADWTLWRASDGALIHYNNAYKPGGGSWADSSDARIKDVLGDYTSGLDAINALRPVRYTFKGNDTDEAPKDKPDYIPEYTDPITPGPPLEEMEKLAAEAAGRGGGAAATVPYWNSAHYEAARNSVEFIGLIAQEAEGPMPEIVKQRTAYIDGVEVTDLRDIDTTPLIFALINSCKELSAKNDMLEARIVALEAG